ncbi:hypothetical protein HHK36_012407 [Tetracentron sinense]|uniref:Beta-glucosidase n=1 Tax=Tetracentron sinense TaxID=13715 RepID=A0A834ZAC9_TETSI|nr:hypothetical protein HHK36_012407 [Tetracentron sinense]
MWSLSSSLFLLLLTLAAVGLGQDTAKFSRDDFPSHFVFGSGSSAYQVEGAAFEDGKSPSIWDTSTHSGNLKNKSKVDRACDQYHKYKEDVKLMVDTGLEGYRFSISWSRLIPNGRGPVNPKGLQYYNNLINELVSHGIQPHVTLFHFDLPQVLEDEKDFTAYADVCFREFGDRVSYWTTVNEANVFVLGGYDLGFLPPQRCSSPFGFNCARGNSTWEPYVAAHNILLTHASVARLYKNKYQAWQHGLIGINMLMFWFIPLTNATEDVLATQRANDFYVGWFLNPLVFGDYPDIIKKNAGLRIPFFTPRQSKQVKGSFDFLGLNHYMTLYIKDNSNSLKIDQRDFNGDMAAEITCMLISFRCFQVGTSIESSLNSFDSTQFNFELDSVGDWGLVTLRNASLNDTSRVNYLNAFIGSLLDAVRNGSNARGYFTWSFLDAFELLDMDSFKSSFGLYYVDLDDPELKRYPKLSAHCVIAIEEMLSLPSSLFLLLLALVAVGFGQNTAKFSRDDFPSHFVFGSGTSAYQEDVKLMVDTGLEGYRFSISWSRLIPNGRGPVNPKGLQYYNNLINELISHGIQPHVTLFHSDLPQVLEDEYGGWLSQKIVKDFTAYADVCFREFGDRVSYWTTVNEANVFVLGGYDLGYTPPQRCSSPFGFMNCANGNSTWEPYLAAHNILLAHASAARLYKNKYQAWQHGFIGISLYTFWFIPLTNATEDVLATQRANDFYVGWFLNPLVFGDYPNIVKENVGSRLPSFTPQQSEQVKGSFNFLGLNHYLSLYVKDNSNSLKIDQRDFDADMAAKITLNWLIDDEFPINSSGLQGVLEYMKQVYGNPPIYIHENGQKTLRSVSFNDTSRVNYMSAFIGSLLDAVRNGSNARGYFAWTFLDVYELLDGFKSTFGLYYVDMDDPELKRYPKLSAQWYSSFLKGKSINSNGTIETEKNSYALSQTHLSQ